LLVVPVVQNDLFGKAHLGRPVAGAAAGPATGLAAGLTEVAIRTGRFPWGFRELFFPAGTFRWFDFPAFHATLTLNLDPFSAPSQVWIDSVAALRLEYDSKNQNKPQV